MYYIYIIFGIILFISFVTGLIITIIENKNGSGYEENNSDHNMSSNVVTSNDTLTSNSNAVVSNSNDNNSIIANSYHEVNANAGFSSMIIPEQPIIYPEPVSSNSELSVKKENTSNYTEPVIISVISDDNARVQRIDENSVEDEII